MKPRFLKLVSIAGLAAATAIAGSSQQDQTDVKTATDTAASQVKKDAKEVSAEAWKGMTQAKEAVTAAAQEAKESAKVTGDKINGKVSDAVITTTVKAELAKDKDLSALKISVETDSGRVALRGTARSRSSRDHASALALAVKGVVNVDNQLIIEPGKG